MPQANHIFFDDSLCIAGDIINCSEISANAYIIRDIHGKIRLLLSGQESEYNSETLEKLRTDLSTRLGNYGYAKDETIIFSSSSEFIQAIINDQEWQLYEFADPSQPPLRVIERQINGRDWLKEPLSRRTTTPWITFYGVKGGVGRSTALIVWSTYLAKKGKKVLVFDLDLESPGISESILATQELPEFGIIDWFIEDGANQSNAITNKTIATSSLSRDLPGEIRVVPAYGASTKNYMAKLSRCYADKHNRLWAERLLQMIEDIEEIEKPDVIFLDSRAGIHDISAVLLTRLGAYVLLFSANTSQSWKAYEILLSNFQKHKSIRDIRDKFQIVASMLPDTRISESLEAFTEMAWELFRTHIYDAIPPEAIGAALNDNTSEQSFSFDLGDSSAPHSPLPILWHNSLQEFAPLSMFEEKLAYFAFQGFIERANYIFGISNTEGTL